MLVQSQRQVLPVVTDYQGYYVAMQPFTTGLTSTDYVSTDLLYNPATKKLTVTNLVVSSLSYANGQAFVSGGGSGLDSTALAAYTGNIRAGNLNATTIYANNWYWGNGSAFSGPQGPTGATGPSNGPTGATGPTGITNYSNSNVAAYLTTYTGNLAVNYLTVTNNFSLGGVGTIETVLETVTVNTYPATTENINILNGSVILYNSASQNNFIINVRGNSTTTLNNLMNTGQSISLTVMITNTSTGYFLAGFQIDGTTVLPQWAAGVQPSSGNINSTDIYSFTMIKTGNAAFKVFGSQAKFA
jgi:hypothetical protein